MKFGVIKNSAEKLHTLESSISITTYQYHDKGNTMTFESIEIRQVCNGVVVTLRTADEDQEYVFDTDRKSIKFVKDLLESKNKKPQTSE